MSNYIVQAGFVRTKAHPIFVALLVAGYPIFASLALLAGVDSQAFTVPYRAVLLILCGVIVWHFRSDFLAAPPALVFGLGVFWLMYSLRLLFDLAIYPTGGMRLQPKDYFIATYGMTIPPCLAALVGMDQAMLRRGLVATFWVNLVAVALSVFTLYGVGYGLEGLDVGRLGNEVLSPIAVSLSGAMLVALALCILTVFPATRKLRIWAALALFPGFLALYLGSSRGPAIALMITVAIMTVILLWRGKSIRVLIGISFVSLAALVMLESASDEGGSLNRRLLMLRSLEDQSDNVRLILWDSAWNLYLSSPAFGAAIEEEVYGYYPHNIVLESLMSIGTAGGMLSIALMAAALFCALKLAVRLPESVWFASVCIFGVLAGLTTGGIYSFPLFWFASVAAIATYAKVSADEQREQVRVLAMSPRTLSQELNAVR